LIKFLSHIKEQIKLENLKKLCEYIEDIGENPCLNPTDLSSLTEKINKISIKSSENFIFTAESMLNLFNEMNVSQKNNNDENQEIPNFDDFIKLNENSNKENFFKGFLNCKK